MLGALERDSNTGLDLWIDIWYKEARELSALLEGGNSVWEILLWKIHGNERLGRQKANIPDLTISHSRDKPSLSDCSNHNSDKFFYDFLIGSKLEGSRKAEKAIHSKNGESICRQKATRNKTTKKQTQGPSLLAMENGRKVKLKFKNIKINLKGKWEVRRVEYSILIT